MVVGGRSSVVVGPECITGLFSCLRGPGVHQLSPLPYPINPRSLPCGLKRHVPFLSFGPGDSGWSGARRGFFRCRMLTIKLDPYECILAGVVAVMWKVKARSNKYEEKHGTTKEDKSWDLDIEGACGEMAFSKAYNLYWSGNFSAFKLPDVGPYQIRTTKSYSLILRKDDNVKDVYVLVCGRSPDFVITGWCYGWEFRKDEYFRDPTNSNREKAYFIPKHVLHPIESLPTSKALVNVGQQ
jgi:hypothetical protein